jgi:predicted amidohydrolase YtcJ
MSTPGDILATVSTRGEWIVDGHRAGATTQDVDLAGAVMFPGFIDAHVHLEYPERYDRSLDNCTSRHDLVEELGRKAASEATNAAYRRWYASLPDRDTWPDKGELDSVSPELPVILSVGGFVYLLNSAALRSQELEKALLALPEAMVVRDENENPTGLVRDDALLAVDTVYPRTTSTSARVGVERGLKILAECGVTHLHHMVKTRDVVQFYQELRSAGRLPLRVGLIIRGFAGETTLEALELLGLRQGFGDRWLQLQGVKFVLDGAFPGGGAAFREPYLDEPDSTGNLLIAPDRFRDLILRAHAAGIRCCVHTVGDRAVDVALDTFQEVLGDQAQTDHRHRLEHAGNIMLHEDQLERIKNLSMVVVVNPTYAYQRATRAHLRLGEQRSNTPLPVRSMLDGGVTVVAASDFSGAYPADPIRGIAFLVSRRSADGATLAESEAVSVWEAMSLYTSQAAWASFQEDVKGTIEVGKLADFVILDRDPFSTPPEALGDTRVLATIVGGEVVYESPHSPIDWSATWQG